MEHQRETRSFRARPRPADFQPRPPSEWDVSDPSELDEFARPSRPLPTRRLPEARPGEQTFLVPALPRTVAPRAAVPPADTPRAAGGSGSRWSRPLMFAGVALTVIVVVAVSALQALQGGGGTPNAVTPPPTGRGPWSASAGSVRVIPAPTVAQGVQGAAGGPLSANSLEPCHDTTMFLPAITQWSVPPGCYGNVYQPNPANYIQRPGFGYCNWWVRVNHPNHADITENISYPRGAKPAVGAAVFFFGNEQGATSEGHWAQVVAIAPDNYWVLISEMNFAWRGAGFGKIDYRYIHVSPGVQFVYIYS
ncbi:MAG: hypothetical protein ACRDHP_05650 [Ktedonobacterales bacterium]